MTISKEELVIFLKENLTIETDLTYAQFAAEIPHVKVKLLLDGEMISEDTAY